MRRTKKQRAEISRRMKAYWASATGKKQRAQMRAAAQGEHEFAIEKATVNLATFLPDTEEPTIGWLELRFLEKMGADKDVPALARAVTLKSLPEMIKLFGKL